VGGLTVCNAANFANSIHFIAGSYKASSGATPPSGAVVGSRYSTDLAQAFTIAPPAFQTQLCGLDGVFIDPTACTYPAGCFGTSWGLAQRRFGSGRYIAVSAALWNDRPSYSRFETNLINTLLPLSPVSYINPIPASDTFAMTVLAALAHEMGHVRFNDIFAPGPGLGNFDPTQLCGGNTFISWNGGAAHIRPPPSWRHLLTQNERHLHPVPDVHKAGAGPQIWQIDNALNSGTAGDLLDQLYAPDAPWASFFAAIAPDEDFVETYKLKVLTQVQVQPPLTSLIITMPGTAGQNQENVPDDLLRRHRKTELAGKLTCIPTTF
jgi:hypothetical protein